MNREKGFTLLEILVALIVLSIAITGMLVLYASAKKFVLHNRSTFGGVELGRVFMDPLQSDVRQDTWGTANNCLSSNPTVNCSGSKTINGISYSPVYSINTVAGTNLRRATVTINWTEPNP